MASQGMSPALLKVPVNTFFNLVMYEWCDRWLRDDEPEQQQVRFSRLSFCVREVRSGSRRGYGIWDAVLTPTRPSPSISAAAPGFASGGSSSAS